MSGHNHGGSSANYSSTTSSSVYASSSASASASSSTTTAQTSHGHGGGGGRNSNRIYAEEFVWFTVGIVGVAMALNLYSVLWALWRRRRLAHGDVPSPSPRKTPNTGLVRLPSAVTTAWNIFAYRWRIPAVNMYVLEVLLTAAYVTAMLLWTFLNQTGTGFANRAGDIAAAQTPLLVALAMKNNIIGWATGLGHEKLTLLHRAVSRALLLEVWIHGGARFYISPSGALRNKWRIYGLVAGCAFAVLVSLSIAPIRRRFYEGFLALHLAMVAIYLVCSLLHCKGDGQTDYYIWPCFAIWGLDRLCRWARYAILSGITSPNKTTCEVEMLNHDTLRVTATRRVPGGWRAGQHFFVCFPTLGPLESHPFSIASVADADATHKKIVWIVRTRDGLTKRLKNLVESGSGVASVPLLLDGPYGAPPDITPFSTCVFFAGGSGVAYTLPRFHELVMQVASKKACARRAIFVWALRHHSHLKWVTDELDAALAAVPTTLDVTVLAYVTSDGPVDADPTHSLDDDTDTGSAGDLEKDAYADEKMPPTPSTISRGVEVRVGRPDVAAILEDAVRSSEGPVSVDVSGPHGLVMSIRKALSSSFAGPGAVLRGAPTVQLNVEDFSM